MLRPTRRSSHKTIALHPDTEQQQQHQNTQNEHQHQSIRPEETTAIQDQLQEDQHPTFSQSHTAHLERETPNQHATTSAQRQGQQRSSSNMTPVPVLVPDSADESETEFEGRNFDCQVLGNVARLTLDLQCIELDLTLRHQNATIDRMSMKEDIAEVLLFMPMALYRHF